MRTPSRVTEDEWRQWIWTTPFQVGVNKATRNDFLLLGMFKKRETTTVGILGCWQVGQLFLERDERTCNGTTKRSRCRVGENTGKVPNPCKPVRWNCQHSCCAFRYGILFAKRFVQGVSFSRTLPYFNHFVTFRLLHRAMGHMWKKDCKFVRYQISISR